jgi:hypothetical protein
LALWLLWVLLLLLLVLLLCLMFALCLFLVRSCCGVVVISVVAD